MPENKLKTTVLTLILASMIISGCSNGTTAVQTTAQTTVQTAVREAEQTSAEQEEPDSGQSDNDEASEKDPKKEKEKEKEEAQEYLNALSDAFHRYADASGVYSDSLEAEKYDDARSSLNDMDKALDEFQNITAPEKYVPNQARLRTCATIEHDYVRLCRSFTEFCEKRDSLTEEDQIELEGITNEMKLTESGLADEILELIKTVKADIDSIDK